VHDGIYANLYKMTYAQEQAQKDQASVGEDEAVAMRRRGDLGMTGAPAPAGGQ